MLAQIELRLSTFFKRLAEGLEASAQLRMKSPSFRIEALIFFRDLEYKADREGNPITPITEFVPNGTIQNYVDARYFRRELGKLGYDAESLADWMNKDLTGKIIRRIKSGKGDKAAPLMALADEAILIKTKAADRAQYPSPKR